jgi:uncharacterized protein YbbK (DUF523 family)
MSHCATCCGTYKYQSPDSGKIVVSQCPGCGHGAEIARLRARIAVLEEEDRQWDKHSLVQIVEERNRLRARDEAAKELVANLEHEENCLGALTVRGKCSCGWLPFVRRWEEAGR